jgi:hypothetical protein
MTLTAFGPVQTSPNGDSFYLAIPGTPASLVLCLADPDRPSATLDALRDGQMVSAVELYALLPALADAHWKPMDSGALMGSGSAGSNIWTSCGSPSRSTARPAKIYPARRSWP